MNLAHNIAYYLINLYLLSIIPTIFMSRKKWSLKISNVTERNQEISERIVRLERNIKIIDFIWITFFVGALILAVISTYR